MRPVVWLTREEYNKLSEHDLDILTDNFNVKISEPVSDKEINGKS